MVKWTEEEDAELVRLVGIHGEKKWALISGLIPPRTRGSVRERWVHNLDPNLNKNPFTQEEDAIIMEEEARGTAWSVMLSRLARGRTDRMVKNRYKNTLVKRRNQPTLEELEASYDTFLAKAAELGRDIALRKAKMAAEAATDVAETAADVAETLADAAEGAADADLVLPLPHWPSKEVRAAFIAFFEGKGHANWTVPLVRHDCQTRHFAGMKLYNPIFLGTNDPDTNRACYTQKCIGVSEYTQHHTFYEVLENWSFGNDYFKEEAIQWAWELLTKVYKLPGEKIYATYFGGDEELGLKDADEEAKKEWLKVLPASRVLPCENNFWKMGDTGPCGPCTEIHFDSIGRPDGASLGNKDEPTGIEIWSLVFIQYNMEAGVLKPLTAKHVGTGMGFERLTSILQNKMSHYDTDIFMPIFDAIQQATKARPYTGKVGADDLGEVDMAYRVVADHIRTISFAIADGSCPGNDGRGYVLRRILQQAVKYGTGVLKAQPYFFSGLVQVVVDVMSDDFPELKEHYIKIRDIIADEEASFGSTFTKVLSLSQGTEKFKKAAQEVQGKTLGEQQAGAVIAMGDDATASLHGKGVSATDDSFKYIWFQDHTSVIKAIYSGAEFLESVVPGKEVGLILETTSFYAEQGGQIYDTGIIEGPDGAFEVSNVQIYGEFVMHIGSFRGKTGRRYIGHKVVCKVDYGRRTLIASNHTCTHMLNFALREVLGKRVRQKGSTVLPEKLIYDFSHGKPVKLEELSKIESIVNKQIKAELDVFAKEAKLADAKRVNGLRFLEEVYTDPVRIVSVGRKVEDLLANPKSKEWLSISAELCGGTHISNTREAKAFAILQEEGIAKGIRRITAVTLDYAFKAFELAASLEQEMNEASKTEGSILEQKVTALNSRVEGASVPSATKSVLKAKLSVLQGTEKFKKAAQEVQGKTLGEQVEPTLCLQPPGSSGPNQD